MQPVLESREVALGENSGALVGRWNQASRREYGENAFRERFSVSLRVSLGQPFGTALLALGDELGMALEP